jgi:molybdopterin-synthase adenylyltransferase
MSQLVFAGGALQLLRDQLLGDHRESAAILLARTVGSEPHARLLVCEIHTPLESDYEIRSPIAVQVKPEFGLPIEKKAKREGLSLVYCHTHPGQSGRPCFSSIDDESERALADYARGRSPRAVHGALLIGPDGLDSRVLGTSRKLSVIDVGTNYQVAFDPEDASVEVSNVFDRQVRAFGEVGQRRLARLTVGVVGLGGTGSVVVQQLAHLGVKSYMLIDPDVIEDTNLNRVVGATRADVGVPKVEVARSVISKIRGDAAVKCIQGDIVDEGVFRGLEACDFVFCCTDSQASRHLLNQFAYQYFIPCIDIGVAINATHTKTAQIAGRVTMLAPGLPCLWCAEQLQPGALRVELMSEEHRKADPYIVGGLGERQPAVISINSTLSSLAVTMYLAAVCGIPSSSRFLIYDGNRGRVSALAVAQNPNCNFCSPDSTLGGGDQYPLPQRKRG